MASVKRTLEILLHSVSIPAMTVDLDGKSSHLVTAGLIWPRVGVAKKSSALPCTLEKGYVDCEPLNWGKRIVFKEAVEGRFALEVGVTEDLDDEELEKFLRSFLGSALAFGADAAAPLMPLVGALASAPLEYLGKEIAKYPGPATIAEGLAELDAADFPAVGNERLLTVQLRTAKAIYATKRRRVNGRTRAVRKLVLDKGVPNGEMTFLIRTIA